MSKIKKWLMEFNLNFTIILIWSVMVLVSAKTGELQSKPVSDAQGVFFEKMIRPLFFEKCVTCHGSKLQQGELRLDAAEHFRRGGKSGPVVVPGDSSSSLLMQLVQGKLDLQMPPTGPLNDREIKVLEKWIQDGAIWPENTEVRIQNTPEKSEIVFQPPDHPDLKKNLQVWLKAKFSKLKDGEALSSWPDISGHDNNLEVIKNGLQFIKISGVHEQPAIRFLEGNLVNFSKDLLKIRENPTFTTVFVGNFRLPTEGKSQYAKGLKGTSNRPFIISMAKMEGNQDLPTRFYLNGQKFPLLSNSKSSISDLESFLTGVLLNAWSVQGDLSEVVVYDKALSETELRSIEGYLAEEYDILMPWNVDEATVDFTEKEKSFWAFQPVIKYKTPNVNDKTWSTSWLDDFVLKKLEENGLQPAPPVDKRTLIRRLYFKLLGLPPTPQEVEDFVNDGSHDAYESLVERLLNSPHYGERWARHWLDVARYADTTAHDGNFVMRYAYRYRDYVIRSFNSDKPYDQFVFEQLAGDLMPGKSNLQTFIDRITATGFLILGPKALAEQDKEKLLFDIVDEQLDVIGRSFLGLTISCSRCHDHKFDPIPTADYYSLAGILKSTSTMDGVEAFTSKWQEWPLIHLLRKRFPEKISPPDYPPELNLARTGNVTQSSTHCEFSAEKAIDGVFNNYQQTEENDSAPWLEIKLGESGPIGLIVLWNRVDTDFKKLSNFQVSVLTNDHQLVWSEVFFPDGEKYPTPAEGFRICPPSGTKGQIIRIELLGSNKAKERYLHIAEAEVFSVGDCSKPPEDPLMVMAVKEGSQIPMRIMVRGNHENPGKLVPRRFLQILSHKENPVISGEQSGRLELAKAIANSNNPLTARVMVNRIWQWHFGTGLVATSDNFGKLGEKPSHPKLLDRLASYFVSSGWSIKQMHRLLLMSSTYKMQSSIRNPQAEVADANNRLLWKFPRHRLEVEALRDAMLAISGSLDRTMQGSIFDYEEKTDAVDHFLGLFSAANAGYEFEAYQSVRRSIYLPVVRNQLFPLFKIFDFADSNAVTSKRNDSTVATQALYMMNSLFVKKQASRFAERLLNLKVENENARINLAHLNTLGRLPSVIEKNQALTYLKRYNQNENNLSYKEQNFSLDAWSSYCQLLFGLNEFLYID